ncbi:MAG: pyridine nucleotide-disulfide oxidoreductase [Variovorax paradoxus]|nr:MAG: pyridine nucleotide-disulfide oxidoreductase [Variovorax paradoxus]PZQ04494.1 MAG: pyridine nucleotide-disulfide oxidoreductase [Variovorax paradoxus]
MQQQAASPWSADVQGTSTGTSRRGPEAVTATTTQGRHLEQPRVFDFLLVGGGLASATAAETLRTEGATGSIAIVAAEPLPPYHRPQMLAHWMLSKAPAPPRPVLPERYYPEHGIDLLLGTRAKALDTAARLLHVDRGPALRYGRLLIATGAHPRPLAVPGAGLQGIHHLRNFDDVQAIRAAARRGGHAVLVGASFIGLELAAVLLQWGMRVTMLAREYAVFDTLRDPRISEFVALLCRERGIDIVPDEVLRIEGRRRAEVVVTRGGRQLPCDMVCVGIGVTPEIGFLEGSGLALDDGVLVDACLQTSCADVFAAGDVANFTDTVFGCRRRVEHWDNAVKQGRLAARNMLGQRLAFDEVSVFFGELFDSGFQFVGRAEGTAQRAQLGSIDSRSFALLYLEDDVPRALFTTGRTSAETRAIQALVRYRTNLAGQLEKFSVPGFTLETIPTQTVLVLQGGGALGAFECGAVRALHERGVRADIVAGVSIGAMNGAIIASHPDDPCAALRAFWNDLAVGVPAIGDEGLREWVAAWQIFTFGVPNFFTPRWWCPPGLAVQGPSDWTSLYDPEPMRGLLRRYVDFATLRHSRVRLLVSAVDVQTAELKVFDSYVDNLTVDHILASGSLPPGLPWTTIEGRHYWDGGIVSNSPLQQVLERSGGSGKRIYAIDLFPGRKPLPGNLFEVLLRRDEIVYAERVRRDTAQQALVGDFRKLVDDILCDVEASVAARLRQRPRFIQLMSGRAELDLHRIQREPDDEEPATRDYDFSRETIARLDAAGYRAALECLAAQAHPSQMENRAAGVRHGTRSDGAVGA